MGAGGFASTGPLRTPTRVAEDSALDMRKPVDALVEGKDVRLQGGESLECARFSPVQINALKDSTVEIEPAAFLLASALAWLPRVRIRSAAAMRSVIQHDLLSFDTISHFDMHNLSVLFVCPQE